MEGGDPFPVKPGMTLVFPAHDYKGDTVSTIGEEKRYNPRLQVTSVDEYAALMASLDLPNPKMMDVAVPANMHVGLHQEELARQGLALSARDAINSLGRPDILLVDLRETSERAKHGTISGALHAPYPGIAESLKPGGMLREVTKHASVEHITMVEIDGTVVEGIASVNEWANCVESGAQCIALRRNPHPDQQDLNVPRCLFESLGIDAFAGLPFEQRVQFLGNVLKGTTPRRRSWLERIERLMRVTSWPKPIREALEIHLINLVEDHHHGLLNDLVFQRGP